jgi:predicted O-methyltransferase YrrM
MKRVDRLRIRHDDEIARLMETEAGQAEYWRRLDDECHESPLVWLLEESLALEGDVIECGVYRGGSTRLMGRRMRDMAPGKRLFACDSFEGFPQDRILDADLGPFRFRFKIRRKFRHAMDVPGRLIAFFDTYRVNGHVVKGFFSETLPRMRRRKYCFMFIDCDIYESHLDCLNVLYDQLVPGGIVVFDDYAEPKWPGASRAVDEFFADQPVKPEQLMLGHKSVWFVRKPLAEQKPAETYEPPLLKRA